MTDTAKTGAFQYQTSVYFFGSGNGGALGIDCRGKVRKLLILPTRLEFGSNVTSISAGNKMCSVTTRTGCYSWGSGPIGRKSTSIKESYTPRRIKMDQTVVRTSHGENHSTIVTNEGNLFVFGDATSGKLGIQGRYSGNVLLPRQTLLEISTVVDSVCSNSSTTVLLSDGSVVMLGVNGQLIKNKKVQQTVPCTVEFPVKIAAISSGRYHCAAISIIGECYTWGSSDNGRLGHGTLDDDIVCKYKPTRVEYFFQHRIVVKNVACGGAHTCVLSEDKHLIFSFGWNRYFQCGIGDAGSNEENIETPRQVQLSGKIIEKLSCGFAHSAIVTNDGELWVWGFNEEGQLGLGHELNVPVPTAVNFHQAKDAQYILSVACGNVHTLCLTSKNSNAEFEELKKMIEYSARVLFRFGRFVLLQIRMRKYQRKYQIFSTPQKQNDTITVSLVSSYESTLSSCSTSISSCKSELYDEIDTEVETLSEIESYNNFDKEHQDFEAEVSRIEMESVVMKHEDSCSKKVSNAYQEKRKAKVEMSKRIWELEKMEEEELLSKNYLKAEKRYTLLENKLKLKKSIDARNLKTKLMIEKEAERLKKAREAQSKTKQVLPRIRKQLEYVQHGKKKKAEGKKERHCSLPTLFSRRDTHYRMNQQLLENRNLRLLRQDKEKKEELEKNFKILELERQTSHMNRDVSLMIVKKEQKYKRLMQKTKLQSTIELDKLKKQLQLPNNKENQVNCDYNESKFQTVQKWSNDIMLSSRHL